MGTKDGCSAGPLEAFVRPVGWIGFDDLPVQLDEEVIISGRQIEWDDVPLYAVPAGWVPMQMPMEATDKMIDAACAAVPDLYRVDAMRAIDAALATLVPNAEVRGD